MADHQRSRETPVHPRPVTRGEGRRLGRPARIDRAAIMAATAQIPLEQLTMRSVAEHLGVSVPSLYHYVGGKQDLRKLAAEQAALTLIRPVDRGQHWAVWFYEWAFYIRQAFAADPELLKHFIDGAVTMDIMAPHLEATVKVCTRQGFSAVEAMHANELVSGCAIGVAIEQIRYERAKAEGRPNDIELRRILACGDQDLPHLASLLDQPAPFAPAPFHEQITTVLAGIALRRGESFAEIELLLRSLLAEQA